MKELKQTLKNMVDGQAFLKSILPVAPVLVLIDPLLMLVYNINYFKFYYQSSGLFFVIYLTGLVLCLAAENDWAIGLAAAIKAIACLVSFANYATFSKIVYVALYGVAAFYFLREFFRSEQGKKIAAGFAAKSDPSAPQTTNCPNCGLLIQALPGGGGFCPQCGVPLPVYEQPEPEPQPVDGFCPQCGQKLPSGTKFCPVCGTPAPEEVSSAPAAVAQGSAGMVNMRTAAGRLSAFCSGGIFLIFTIVMTAKLICTTVLQFNLLSLIGSIPAIIVCLGLWFSWSGSSKRQLKSNGFRLVSGALLANLIISMIPVVVIVIAGVFFLSMDDGAPIGIGLIIGAFIDGLLFYLYWNGLRKPAKSASAIVEGTGRGIETSMFSIVMLFAGGIIALISLLSIAGSAATINTFVNRTLSGLYYYDIPDSVMSTLVEYIRSYFTVDWKTYVVQLLNAATPICAAMTLCSARGIQSR